MRLRIVCLHDEATCRSVCAGDGNVLRDGDAHEVDDEQKSVHDAEELEGDAVKVHENDGQTQSKEQTGDRAS